MVRISATLISLLLLAVNSGSYASDGEANGLDDTTFAKVNGETIALDTYRSALSVGMRQRFYHGAPPADKLQEYRNETVDDLITATLLAQEARRRGLEPDAAAITAQLAAYEKRYGESDEWQKRRETLLPRLRNELANKSLVERMQAAARNISDPTVVEVQAYYRANPEKFTTPMRQRVAVILLRVPPTSSDEVWTAARSEAEKIISRIRAGEAFAALVQEYSDDTASASKGGDLGFLHQGMLAETAEAALKEMTAGDISPPVTLLEGVAIFRLDERKEASLNDYAQVKDRALALLRREREEEAYVGFVAKLRNTAAIQINPRVSNQ